MAVSGFIDLWLPWPAQPQICKPATRWLERGLSHLVVNGHCLVTGQVLVSNGTLPVPGLGGHGPSATGTTVVAATLAQSNLLARSGGLGDYTIGVLTSAPADAQRAMVAGAGDSLGGGTYEPYLVVNCTGGLTSTSGTAGFSASAVAQVNLSGVVDGTLKVYSGRRSGSNHIVGAGTVFSSAAGNATSIWSSSYKFFVGSYVVSASYGLTYSNVPLAFAFDSALTDDELIYINQFPWSLLEPQRFQIQVLAGGGDSQQAESVAFTDSQTSQAIFENIRAETLALTDSQTAQFVSENARAESIVLTDSQIAGLATSNARGESIAFTDSQVAIATFENARAESFTLTDSQTGDTTLVSYAGETFSLSDSQISQAVFENLRAESFALTDTQSSAGSTFNVVNSESVAFAATQTGDVPGSTTIDIMNPYIVVYMWKRVA